MCKQFKFLTYHNLIYIYFTWTQSMTIMDNVIQLAKSALAKQIGTVHVVQIKLTICGPFIWKYEGLYTGPY
jgi:hypothetical protein